MSFSRLGIAVCALAALTLGLGACDSSESDPDDNTTSSAEPTPEESTDDTSDPRDDGPTSEQGSAEPKKDGGRMKVTVAGDQGVLALQHSGSVPDGPAGPSGRKLITGPGGCFAVTNEGPPQLLVFPARATFVLQDGRPSATIAGSETFVGEQLRVDTTEIPRSQVAGVPERCGRGSSDTLLVVS